MPLPSELVAYGLAALAVGGLAWRWRDVRETTLAGPVVWLAVAIVAMAASQVWLRRTEGAGSAAALRLIVASLSLCPAISLFGAKRPQHGPWHLIVASLWLVLALPGLQWLVLAKGGELELHAARAWFLLILWLMGVLNSVFGRYAGCVLVAAAGQALWLAPFFPWPWPEPAAANLSWGLSCFSLGAIAGAVVYGRRRSSRSALDQLWCDFRDAYGVVWSLRVAERINATAQSNGWDVVVTWQGFRSQDGAAPLTELPPEQQRAFRQQIRNLLRRFVSERWIAQRVEEG